MLGLTLLLAAAWSPAYFWMWNGPLERTELCRQLKDMSAHGLENVCVHPFPREFRPGSMPADMAPHYLSDDYLKLLGEVFDYGASLGMNLWLYDEGGWPSGGAAGQVVKSDPEGRFAPRMLRPDGRGGYEVVIRPYADPARAAPYPSILEKGTTDRFIALTHDRLERAVGRHFGKSVRFLFTDEPAYVRDIVWKTGDFRSLTWTADFPEVFRAKKGYDILPRVGELFIPQADPARPRAAVELRIDYLDVVADLFAERYLAPLQAWGKARGLLSGGHFGGEDEPDLMHRHGAGDLMRSLEALDLPGVDVIWRQLSPDTAELPFPRYASSVAHQNGQPYVLSESFGIYGNAVTPDLWKWLVDYQLVRGVTTFVFGYYNYTNKGSNLTRMEPHAGPCRPEWDFLPPFYDYAKTRCRALGEGTSVAETAVLFDTRDFWAGGADARQALTNHFAASVALERRHVDYDFVSDGRLAAAQVRDGTLTVGRMSYRTLVLPHSKWMSRAARAKVSEFERGGGCVVRGTDVSRVEPSVRIEGARADEIRAAKRRTAAGGEVLFLVNASTSVLSVAVVSGGRRIPWTFAPHGSALFADGRTADEPWRPVPADARRLTDWTFAPTVSHEATAAGFVRRRLEKPARRLPLGDWRPELGETFCGRALYRTTFRAAGGRARLDLGTVCWTCSVRLNGERLKDRFFGPFAWDVRLKDGENVLEVEVANTLANLTGDPAFRDRILRDFPPAASYETRQREFDRANHASGLFGPVTLADERTSPIPSGKGSRE